MASVKVLLSSTSLYIYFIVQYKEFNIYIDKESFRALRLVYAQGSGARGVMNRAKEASTLFLVTLKSCISPRKNNYMIVP